MDEIDTTTAVSTGQMERRARAAVVFGLSLPLVVWVALGPRIPQPLSYHEFADERTLFAIAHFWNVVSNLPFGVIGLLGCFWLARWDERASAALATRDEWHAYAVLFVGEVLTCFGSGYYHLHPNNTTLVWDRMAFSLMLTSTFTIIVSEFMDARVGRCLLVPMTLLGAGSVLIWARSESVGLGDLRLYLTLQFYPVLTMPLVLILFRSRYTHGWTFGLLWILFVMAKFAEAYDARLYEWIGWWSGHTLKHLLAAAASCLPLYGLRHRKPETLDAVQGPFRDVPAPSGMSRTDAARSGE